MALDPFLAISRTSLGRMSCAHRSANGEKRANTAKYDRMLPCYRGGAESTTGLRRRRRGPRVASDRRAPPAEVAARFADRSKCGGWWECGGAVSRDCRTPE